MGESSALLPAGLYVVASPLGNLGDMTLRAIETLKNVDQVAAEDMRHSSKLLRRFDIDTPLLSYHEHSDPELSRALAEQVLSGQRLALISDAGTPLISDPGYRLVRAVSAAGARVVPIPGPCAVVAALSALGVPSERFAFEGFLPSRAQARRKHLEALCDEPRAMVFYEAPHRVAECLGDMAQAFGAEREAGLAREISKIHETLRRATLGELAAWVRSDQAQRRGEMTVVVRGCDSPAARESADWHLARQTLEALVSELPLGQAAALAAKIHKASRNELYRWALDNLDDLDTPDNSS